jgi:AraC-like DNA-binding protein
MTKIAEITGYQSVSAFSTAFKRQTGLSPILHVQTLQMAVSTKRIRQAADQSAADQKKPAAAGFFCANQSRRDVAPNVPDLTSDPHSSPE